MSVKLISLKATLLFSSLAFLLGATPYTDVLAQKPPKTHTQISEESEEERETHSFTLTRYSGENNHLSYAQHLTVKGRKFNLNRASTRKPIKYVKKASADEKGCTHLVAQAVCRTTESTWYEPFTTTMGFPGVAKTKDLLMDWISRSSQAKSNDKYYIREPEGYLGGHAEPQFLSDFGALFTHDSDAIVKTFVRMFLPPSNDTESVYLCGLELFGPYDMCDAFNNKGKNKYDCVGKMKVFRKMHQSGAQSLSDAIRTELKRRKVKFKGADEDAFVVIYHAHSPYANVDSYRAEDDDGYKRLEFSYMGQGGQFCRSHHFKNFKKEMKYELSQRTNVLVEPDALYGYIHLLGDRTAKYEPKHKRFSFPTIEVVE